MAHSLEIILSVLPQLEVEIDRLVYELNELTVEEIALVERKERNKSQ